MGWHETAVASEQADLDLRQTPDIAGYVAKMSGTVVRVRARDLNMAGASSAPMATVRSWLISYYRRQRMLPPA